MTDAADTEPAGMAQIEELLDAYAEARLAPAGPVLARMRAHVLAEAGARVAVTRAVDTVLPRPSRWRLPEIGMPRRALALGTAAVMVMSTAVAVLAAPPGSPFYGARVALEGVLLPNQLDARLAAHEQHINDRLAEAQAAAARGDAAGLAAALDAYQSEVDAAVADVGDDPSRLAQLEAELAKHTAVLVALAARLPEQAAIEHAIEASQKATTKLHERVKPERTQQPGPRATPADDQGGNQGGN